MFLCQLVVFFLLFRTVVQNRFVVQISFGKWKTKSLKLKIFSQCSQNLMIQYIKHLTSTTNSSSGWISSVFCSTFSHSLVVSSKSKRPRYATPSPYSNTVHTVNQVVHQTKSDISILSNEQNFNHFTLPRFSASWGSEKVVNSLGLPYMLT